MINSMRRAPMLVVILAALAPWAGGLRAEDNTSVLITTNFNNGGTNYTVGNTGTSNLLTISGGGKLVNVASGIIGSASTANTNTVVVTGSGSMWTNGGSLTVGSSGSFNTLIISNGALVTTATGGTIGSASGSFSNAVRVTGSGSVWSNTTSGIFFVGNSGSSNTLIIANSGVVYQAGSGFYIGNAGRNNSVLVTDTGSVLQMTSPLTLNNGALLMVVNGGKLFSSGGVNASVIGQSASGNSNSTLVVAGPGSSWTNGGNVQIGQFGGLGVGNSLYVTNGGQATFGASILYGTNNLVYLAGGNASISNSANSTIGAGTSSFNNKVRILDGATNWSTGVSVGGTAGASSNVLEVAGTGSALLAGGNPIQVGFAGGIANSLYVTNGGRVLSGAGTVGHSIGTIASSGVITNSANGTNTMTTVSTNLTVAPDGNLALVDGGFWSNTSTLNIGAAGTGNRLVVSNGGVVVSAGGTIGSGAYLISNFIYNITTIATNGGAVFSTTTNVGLTTPYNVVTNANHSVLVSDNGSLWNSAALIVGSTTPGNTLTITNGGTLISTTATIGNSAGANSNSVLVVGGSANSLWNLGGSALTIGAVATTGNVLTVSSGGVVTNAGTVVVGAGGTSLGNQLNLLGGSFSASSLLATNTGNTVTFNSGTMNLGGSFFSNGVQFVVGDGLNRAVFNTLGGTHSFSNGLLIASNSWLTGSGSVIANPSVGAVFLTNGATISPGLGTNGIGAMTVNALSGINGSVYDIQVAKVLGVAGRNWDLLNVSGAMTNLTATDGTNFILRMDSQGANVPDFTSGRTYALKVLTAGSPINLSSLSLDTNSFLNSAGTWNFMTNGGALYLVQSGLTPVSVNVWNAANTGGAWSQAAKWTNSVGPSAGGGTNVVLEFGGSGSTLYVATNDFAGSFTNNAIVLNSSSSAASILMGSNLVFAAGASGAPGIFQKGAGGFVVSNAIVLANDLLFDGAGFGTVTLATNISGSGGITVQGGAYDTVLSGSNTFTGGVVVNSSGGRLVASNQFALGRNNIIVSNGTLFTGIPYTIGTNFSSQQVLVTGAGSVWTNGGLLTVGDGGATSNLLTIANGALVISAGGTLGSAAASAGNSVVVSGAGSIWTNTGAIRVGFPGGANQLIITNGGQVIGNGNAIVGGSTASSTNNLVVVSGLNALWNNGGNDLTMGSAAAGNQMIISSTGKVINAAGIIGNTANGNSNSVTVSSGGIWNNTSTLKIGYSGSGNQLIITNGGLVVNTAGALGDQTGSSNNTVLVTGSGSIWTNSTTLIVGSGASTFGNQLTISSSGLVVNTSGTIGSGSGSSNNTVLVTGSGSIWTNSSTLTMGSSAGANGNCLVITNGGWVSSGAGTIGSAANSNTVTVAGGAANSFWDLRGNSLTVGAGSTTGNVLTVSAGGAVTNVGTLIISSGAGALGNQVNLLGGVLSTTNETVGGNAAGATARLFIAGGTNSVLATSGGNFLIGDTGSTGTVVLADSGALLVATNVPSGGASVSIGYKGYGQLIVSNGTFLARDTYVGQSGSGAVGALQMFGGTASLTNVYVASGNAGASGSVLLAGPGNPLMVVSGTLNVANINNALGSVTVSNGTLRLGNVMYIAGGLNSTGSFNVAGGLVLASNLAPTVLAGGAHNSSATFNQSGGASTFNQLSLFGNTTTTNATAGVYLSGGTLNLLTSLPIGGGVSNNTAVLQVSGGQLNIGSGGIVVSGGTPSATNLFLSGGTLGTLASWSSALNFVLTNNPGSGFVTFAPSLNYTNTLSGILSGNGALVKDGTGWLILSGANTYSGGTTVSNGILKLTGSGTIGSGPLLVGNGGRFEAGSAPYTVNSNLTFQGQSSWNGALNVGSGASLVVTGASATIAGTLTNDGLLQVLNSRVTYSNAVVISGRYFSDPSTNIFTTNVTVTASGSLYGSNGDLFVFYQDLTMQSTNRSLFNLSSASVLFTNGNGTGATNHLFNLSGSSSINKGSNWLDHTQLATNFSIGALTIAYGNRLTLTGSVSAVDGGATNALYVGWLDLSAWSTNASSLTNTLLSALDLEGINLYYDKFDIRNAYLNGLVYEFSQWGAGNSLLIPIPEPSPLLAVGAGLALLAFLRRQRLL